MSVSETTTPTSPPQDTVSNWSMLRTLGAISFVSGILLSLVYQVTFDKIAANNEERIRNTVLELVPGSVTQKEFTFPSLSNPELMHTVYAAYDESGVFQGVALEAVDLGGYGGEIRLLYGYLPDEQQVTGTKVLLCKETPGLGDKIKTDEAFRKNFEPLQVPLNDMREGLLYPLKMVKPGAGGGPGQIEAISGATISSQSVVNAMKQSTEALLPLVQAHLQELKEQGK
ncbi:MAG: RnfABCDGE type electron transport complex subunit G [Candidatus Hydrogenedens sp.]|nr:RnfABCDGE type electron transport complex subunit G [Candidatus Hydrogenedens sp.]